MLFIKDWIKIKRNGAQFTPFIISNGIESVVRISDGFIIHRGTKYIVKSEEECFLLTYLDFLPDNKTVFYSVTDVDGYRGFSKFDEVEEIKRKYKDVKGKGMDTSKEKSSI